VVQVVEHLPSKCEALGSNLSTIKKKCKTKWVVSQGMVTTASENPRARTLRSYLMYSSAPKIRA
jgi:hypothetical protein